MIGRTILLTALLMLPVSLAWGQDAPNAAVPADAPASDAAAPAAPDAAASASGDAVAALPAPEMTEQEKERARLHEDFASFAQEWVARLNADPVSGSSKITVSSAAEGYVARFHRIEFRSSVVRESVSMPGHYSGLLRYWDVVYECEGASEAEARSKTQCHPVDGAAQAYCEIFQLRNGRWN